eukprot:3694585-Pyramimonas_sp.AAC.1
MANRQQHPNEGPLLVDKEGVVYYNGDPVCGDDIEECATFRLLCERGEAAEALRDQAQELSEWASVGPRKEEARDCDASSAGQSKRGPICRNKL